MKNVRWILRGWKYDITHVTYLEISSCAFANCFFLIQCKVQYLKSWSDFVLDPVISMIALCAVVYNLNLCWGLAERRWTNQMVEIRLFLFSNMTLFEDFAMYIISLKWNLNRNQIHIGLSNPYHPPNLAFYQNKLL